MHTIIGYGMRRVVRRIAAAPRFILLVCPDGVAAALTGIAIEVIYRAGVHYGYLQTGFEYFAVAVGVGALVLLLGARVIRYLLIAKNRGDSPNNGP